MIGILKPEKMELLLKDCLYYKLYYCSICRHLVKNHNRLYAFVNTYEGTLIAMLYNEMVVQDIAAVKDRCSGMPIAKVAALPPDHEAVRLGALISLLAFQIKFQDNLDDESGFWVHRYNRTLQSSFRKTFEANREQYLPFNIDMEHIKKSQNELSHLEKNGEGISAIQDCWGKTFSYIMTQPFKDKIDAEKFEALQVFFNGLGKIINIVDSMEDLHVDLKAKRFNLIVSEEKPETPDNSVWLEENFNKYRQKVWDERDRLLPCMQNLHLKESWPIAHNILTHCLDNELAKVFEFMVRKKKNTEQTLFNCKDF